MDVVQKLPKELAARVFYFLRPRLFIRELKRDCSKTCYFCEFAFNSKSLSFIRVESWKYLPAFFCSACLNDEEKLEELQEMFERDNLYVVNEALPGNELFDYGQPTFPGSRCPRELRADVVCQTYGEFFQWPRRLQCVFPVLKNFEKLLRHLQVIERVLEDGGKKGGKQSSSSEGQEDGKKGDKQSSEEAEEEAEAESGEQGESGKMCLCKYVPRADYWGDNFLLYTTCKKVTCEVAFLKRRGLSGCWKYVNKIFNLLALCDMDWSRKDVAKFVTWLLAVNFFVNAQVQPFLDDEFLRRQGVHVRFPARMTELKSMFLRRLPAFSFDDAQGQIGDLLIQRGSLSLLKTIMVRLKQFGYEIADRFVKVRVGVVQKKRVRSESEFDERMSDLYESEQPAKKIKFIA